MENEMEIKLNGYDIETAIEEYIEKKLGCSFDEGIILTFDYEEREVLRYKSGEKKGQYKGLGEVVKKLHFHSSCMIMGYELNCVINSDGDY